MPFFLVSFSLLLSLLFLQAKVIGAWGYIDFPRKPIIIRPLILSTDAIPLNCWRHHPEGIPGSNRGWAPVTEPVHHTIKLLSLYVTLLNCWAHMSHYWTTKPESHTNELLSPRITLLNHWAWTTEPVRHTIELLSPHVTLLNHWSPHAFKPELHKRSHKRPVHSKERPA